jgi:hypothetical protein
MDGKALLTPEGYVLNLETYYKPTLNHPPIDISQFQDALSHRNCQIRDTKIINNLVENEFHGQFVQHSEERTYIKDFDLIRKDSQKANGELKSLLVWFDHVIYCKKNNRAIVLESQDPSHYDPKYYMKKYNISYDEALKKVQDAKDRMEVKARWCQKMGYPFLELPWFETNSDKENVIRQIMYNITQLS